MNLSFTQIISRRAGGGSTLQFRRSFILLVSIHFRGKFLSHRQVISLPRQSYDAKFLLCHCSLPNSQGIHFLLNQEVVDVNQSIDQAINPFHTGKVVLFEVNYDKPT